MNPNSTTKYRIPTEAVYPYLKSLNLDTDYTYIDKLLQDSYSLKGVNTFHIALIKQVVKPQQLDVNNRNK